MGVPQSQGLTDDLWSIWKTWVLLLVPCSGVSVPPGYKPWNLRSSRTPAFSGTAGCFTHYFADYNLLSFMVWFQNHSDFTDFSSYSPFPLPVVPPLLVDPALQLLGAGYPCSHNLLLFFRWLSPRYSLFIPWLLFPPPHFISVYWRVLCMQRSFYRLGPNCVSEHTEAIFPCNKCTSRDA